MVDRKWLTLTAVSAAIFMLLLDITVVNVALPSIQRPRSNPHHQGRNRGGHA